MGIKGLEKFIRESNISEEIKILDEIKKWQSEHGSNPTIIIDVRQLIRVFFLIDLDGLLLGGRYEKFHEILEYFFKKMKEANAELVFILELNESNWIDSDTFDLILPFYNRIKHTKSLKARRSEQMEIDSNLLPTERILYNSLHLISKYGTVSVHYGLGNGATMAYARVNRDNVMALITRDTEFLTYDGDLQYWSLSGVKFRDLKITKFCRQKLIEVLELDMQQMQLLQAISDRSIEFRLNIAGSSHRIQRLAKYVKRQEYGPNGYEPSKLTGDLTEEDRRMVQDELKDVKFNNSYAGDWDKDIYGELILDLVSNDESFNLVLQFCKKNIYFVYKLINEKTTIRRDLLFIDVRQPDAVPFINLVVEKTMKMIGIIFKDIQPDKQPKTRNLYNIFEEGTIEPERDIIYPPMPLPGLKDLIIEEDDKSFDESRWSLLEWLLDLSAESISKVNNSKKELRIVLLTLKFLLIHEIITAREADVILVTELDARTKRNVYVPRHFCPPPPMPDNRFPKYVDIAWVQVAHKYTITFELICHCLELCGLRKETDLILMDACKFHENMNLVENVNQRNNNNDDIGQIERMMTRIADIRLWEPI